MQVNVCGRRRRRVLRVVVVPEATSLDPELVPLFRVSDEIMRARDSLSRAGALRAAYTLRQQWLKCGFDVPVSVTRIRGEGIWSVHADLVNGLPRKLAVARGLIAV